LLSNGVLCVRKEWGSASSGDWHTDNSWNPHGIPGANDDVYINNEGVYTVEIKSQAVIKSLTLGSDDSGKQTLSVQTIISISNGGIITSTGELDFVTGTIDGGGTLIVDGRMIFSDIGAKIVSTIKVQANGVMVLTSGQVTLTNSASLIVSQTGNFTITSKEGITTSDSSNTLINNQGRIIVAPTSDEGFETSIFTKIYNTQTGSFYVASGTLYLHNDTNWQGDLEISDQTNIQADAGTHVFLGNSKLRGNGTFSIYNQADAHLQGQVDIATFIVDGGGAQVLLDGADQSPITFNTLKLKNGELLGSSATISLFSYEGGSLGVKSIEVDTFTVVSTENSQSRIITGTSLSVTSSAKFSSGINLLLRDTSTFSIEQGASMVLDQAVTFLCNKNDTTSHVEIGGKVDIVTNGVEVTCGLIIQAGGLLNVVKGTFAVLDTFELQGHLNVTQPGSINLNNPGPVSIAQVTSSITGDGSIMCSSCNLLMKGNVNFGSITCSGGGSIAFQLEESAPNNFPLLNYFNVSGGTLQLTNNAKLDLNVTITTAYFSDARLISNLDQLLNIRAFVIIRSVAQFSGVSSIFRNLAYVNKGTTNFKGSLTGMELYLTNIFVNDVGALLSVDGSTSFEQSDQDGGYLSYLHNYGTVDIKPASTAILAIKVDNYGSVKVESGAVLHIQETFYTQLGSDATTILLAGKIINDNTLYLLDGLVTGFGTIDGNVNAKGGSIGASTDISPTKIADTTPLSITGNLLQLYPAAVVVSLGQTSNAPAVHGVFVVGKAYQLWGGKLVIQANGTGTTLPGELQFISFANLEGSTGLYDEVVGANFNSSFGYKLLPAANSAKLGIVESPSVTYVTPNTGPTMGGTIVTVVGDHFLKNSKAQVWFGDKLSTKVGWSDTNITAVVPAGTGTQKSICVIIEGRGCTDRKQTTFSWNYLPPVISNVFPVVGGGGDGGNGNRPTFGKYPITILGSNFGNDVTKVVVTFNNNACQSTVLLNDSAIVCIINGSVGTNIPVMLSVDSQKSNTVNFAYDAPVLRAIWPSSGLATGGDKVTLFASNFGTDVSALSITIDGKPCVNLNVDMMTSSLSCTTPSLRAGKNLPVLLSVGGQTSQPINFEGVKSDKTPDNNNNNNHGGLAGLPWWLWLIFVFAAFVIAFVIGFFVSKTLNKRRDSTKK